MLSLPSTTEVNQRLPKEALWRGMRAATGKPVPERLKERMGTGVEAIFIANSLKEATLRIPAGARVSEIVVMDVRLKDACRCGGRAGLDVPTDVLTAVAQAIPNKVVFACTHAGRCACALRRGGTLHVGAAAPLGEAVLQVRGKTLDEVWDSLTAQVALGSADGADVDARLAARARAGWLREEVARLERTLARERQQGRRNALWDQMKQAKEELDSLEGTVHHG